MKIKNKILIIILAIFISNTYTFADTILTENDVSAYSAILIDSDTGKILYGKNEKQRVYPASTTKILTGLLALENLDLNENVTVPPGFGPIDGSSMYLVPGETFTTYELIQGLLIHSANDAAVLLANKVSGSVEAFVQKMNERAKTIGALDTNFVNSNGLHDNNHYTTAYDMALISREAMKNEKFREIVAMPVLSLHETEVIKEKRIYNNTNRFLWSRGQIIYKNQYIPIKYDLIDGIKTGFTDEAGNCLVSSGSKDGMRLIAVVYKANGFEIYKDSRTLIDYGFENFKVQNIINKDDLLGTQEVKFSVQRKLDYTVGENISLISRVGEVIEPKKEIILEKIDLPIKKGDVVGKLRVDINGEISEYNLFALNDIETVFTKKNIKYLNYNDIKLKYKIIFCILLFLVLFIILFLIVNSQRRYRRRRRRRRYR